MSYTIVTDVFCDFCHGWMEEGGACGVKVNKREAWTMAKERGWRLVDGKHMCPSCWENEKEEHRRAIGVIE